MNSKHRAFSVPVDRMDDKKTPETAVAVDLVASTPTDAKVKSQSESTKPQMVIAQTHFEMTQINHFYHVRSKAKICRMVTLNQKKVKSLIRTRRPTISNTKRYHPMRNTHCDRKLKRWRQEIRNWRKSIRFRHVRRTHTVNHVTFFAPFLYF